MGNCVGGGGGVETEVKGQAGVLSHGPSAPEIPVPPAAAAGHFPGPPVCDGAETAPSDAAPPAD